MDAPGLSLIISFYNKLDNLRLILASLQLQTFSDFEVMIADDGSMAEVTRELEVFISIRLPSQTLGKMTEPEIHLKILSD